MHAVVVDVTVNDREASVATLREQVVPMVSSVPGFVAGYWMEAGPSNGHSIAVFESEDAARAVAGRVEAPDGNVTIDNVEVREVVAHA